MGTAPVSYTHLDVYKRQAPVKSFFPSKGAPHRGGRSFLIVYSYFGLLASPGTGCAGGEGERCVKKRGQISGKTLIDWRGRIVYSRYVKFVKILTNKTPKYIHLLSPFIGGETAFLGLSCFAVDTFAALAFRRGRQRKKRPAIRSGACTVRELGGFVAF